MKLERAKYQNRWVAALAIKIFILALLGATAACADEESEKRNSVRGNLNSSSSSSSVTSVAEAAAEFKNAHMTLPTETVNPDADMLSYLQAIPGPMNDGQMLLTSVEAQDFFNKLKDSKIDYQVFRKTFDYYRSLRIFEGTSALYWGKDALKHSLMFCQLFPKDTETYLVEVQKHAPFFRSLRKRDKDDYNISNEPMVFRGEFAMGYVEMLIAYGIDMNKFYRLHEILSKYKNQDGKGWMVAPRDACDLAYTALLDKNLDVEEFEKVFLEIYNERTGISPTFYGKQAVLEAFHRIGNTSVRPVAIPEIPLP